MKAYAGDSFFDLVVVINGMEYTRLALGDSIAIGTDYSQVEIPIPSNKIIRIEALRQIDSGSLSGNELTKVVVWLQAFKF